VEIDKQDLSDVLGSIVLQNVNTFWTELNS